MTKFTIASLALATLLGMGSGCAHRSRYPSADTSLGLQRVVLYRNGVGYFERHGKVDDDILRIKVRRDQVNDLLKSLTVIDSSSGRAVSISMPLDPESWASAALATLTPGRGRLAQVLDGLRGSEITLSTTTEGRLRGRIVMVERIVNEPSPYPRNGRSQFPRVQPEQDHRITLMAGDQLKVVRLSKVRAVTLRDGDLALQLHRRLDASAGEGMFQQIDVDIRLAGAKSHDLVVSYVVAAPMWKPTYRVVLPTGGKGKALLQGWAVVDNTSGEDWNEVKLALTSGEPIAFEYDLHTPRTIDRTDLTESGVRKRARVAMGETTYDYDEVEEEQAEPESEEVAKAEAPAAGEAVFADDYERDKDDKPASSRTRKRSEKKKGRRVTQGGAGEGRLAGGVAGAGPADATKAPGVDFDALRRSTLATARAKQVSGMTRFDLESSVTVPNGSSTMVAIVNHTVEAEETFLYKPGGAGVGYDANPYRVVRFRNTTPFVLEPGPISIYTGDSFVGEGLSEAVGTGTSATIPFAVEPTILVSSSVSRSGDDMHLLRIVRGVLEVESFSRTKTTWTVKGPSRKGGFAVLVRHSKSGWNYALKERPPGTEDLADAYLIPVRVGSGKTEGSVNVVEQTPSKMTISIWDGPAVGLLEKLMVSGDLDSATRKKLEPIVVLRQEIGRIDTEREGLKRQQAEFNHRADETRQSLEAIKKDPAAAKLRRKLGKRLEDFTSEADRLGRRVIELRSQRLEKKLQLDDLLQDIDFRAPPRKPSKTKPSGG